jgi:hypothetical protein
LPEDVILEEMEESIEANDSNEVAALDFTSLQDATASAK